jgi:hypothetical protein
MHRKGAHQSQPRQLRANHRHLSCIFKRFKAGVDSGVSLAAVARQGKIEIEVVAWHNVDQGCGTVTIMLAIN